MQATNNGQIQCYIHNQVFSTHYQGREWGLREILRERFREIDIDRDIERGGEKSKTQRQKVKYKTSGLKIISIQTLWLYLLVQYISKFAKFKHLITLCVGNSKEN